MEYHLPAGFLLNAGDIQYRIIEPLGHGATTAAYLAERTDNTLSARCILKEYAPLDGITKAGKQRFLDAAKRQNDIRQLAALGNQTPPVSRIFEANGTAYIEVVCYGGRTLDRMMQLTLAECCLLCLTIAKTVGYYHRAGMLCLDLKPKNIFVLQNAPDDTVTQLVELIDFDSIRSIGNIADTPISYTRDWAAPEQKNDANVSTSADIYTLGELLFWLVFGRHSMQAEHRGFSPYPFEQCKKQYHLQCARPDVQRVLTALFRGTIRSSPSNRFAAVNEVVSLLEKLTAAVQKRDFIVPKLPPQMSFFVGRACELQRISDALQDNPVLFICGVGGIGKSTLIRQYIHRTKAEYDVIVCLDFDETIEQTFTDDTQLQISTVSREPEETVADYFNRKLLRFREICAEQRVLLVIDNFSGRLTKNLSRLLECGYDTIITTRRQPPTHSFASITVDAIADRETLMRLVSLNLGRSMTKDERTVFAEIIPLIEGHTLVLELIARQIAAGRLELQTALELIRKHGFTHFSESRIGNYKDGEEIEGTLAAIVAALFDAGSLPDAARMTLKVLALMKPRGMETELFRRIVKLPDGVTIDSLAQEGWLYAAQTVRLHAVIAEAVRNWSWQESMDAVLGMELHHQLIDIYAGFGDAASILRIAEHAKSLTELHPEPHLLAMYYDLLGWYYDTKLNGAYIAETQEEAELLHDLFDCTERAVLLMRESDFAEKERYLVQYLLSQAGVLMRSDPMYHGKASRLLNEAESLLQPDEQTPNRCYFLMNRAWYYTLVKPDLRQMERCAKQAADIAEQVFATDLERIDIVCIPTANCYYYHDALPDAADILRMAIALCDRHPDSLPHLDKKAELLNCLLDVYMAQQDFALCRRVIAEIDAINDRVQEHGFYRAVSEEIRRAVYI